MCVASLLNLPGRRLVLLMSMKLQLSASPIISVRLNLAKIAANELFNSDSDAT